MSTAPRLRLLGIAGLVFAASASGRELLFSNVPARYSPIATGAYVHDANGSYQRLSDAIVGQEQERFAPFNFYTAFAVYNLPDFAGPLTHDQLHVPAEEVPAGTLLSADVFAASVIVPEIFMRQSWYIPLQLDVRLAEVAADALVDGTIDAATASTALSAGSLIGSVVVPSSSDRLLYEVPVPLSDAFGSVLDEGFDGPLVLSFTMPFVVDSRQDNFELLYLSLQDSFQPWFDIYRYESPPIAPVPEPSTYAIAGSVLCIAAAVWRRRRMQT